mgnify:CR=1 FL=1
MEELDAKIEKTNYDLSGLESRKKEMEDSKFDKQQNIEKLEEEKRTILAKTDKMNRLEKIIYIAFASKNDLKQVDLLNAKITELRNEKDSIQNKIDILFIAKFFCKIGIASAEQVFGIRQGVLQEFIIFFFERVKRKKNNTEPLANKQPGQEKGGLFRASLNGSDGILKVDEYIFHGYHMKEPSLPE